MKLLLGPWLFACLVPGGGFSRSEPQLGGSSNRELPGPHNFTAAPWSWGTGGKEEAAAAAAALRVGTGRGEGFASRKENSALSEALPQLPFHLCMFCSSAIYLRTRPLKLPKYKPLLKGKETLLLTKFDWRDKNVVTQVRNQLTCGGCWAFSTVGGIESAYAIKGNALEELSVQQVIDCSYNDYGCHGGSTVTALSWMNQTKVKLVRDSEYTFKAKTGLCHYFSHSGFGVSIKGYAAFSLSGQEDEMMKMLINWGPLVVIVDAISWQDYLGGIIQHHCSSGEANHAVLITGFDRTGSIPYWIVQNSWGRTWGIDGYAHIKMGSNICGIADAVSAVFV
uniref:Cathepsin O n=1 Tax=Sphenodon punctatus TaxID=8508 RepID=A0A8D0H4D8_SPHPU